MKTPLDNDLNKVHESFNQNHNHLRQKLMASLPDHPKQHKRTCLIGNLLASTGGTIMKSRITKLAAAAMIIIAILIGVNHFGGSVDIVTSTYALEQTIQAIHSVRYIHVKSFWASHEEPVEVTLLSGSEPGFTVLQTVLYGFRFICHV